VSGSFGGSFCAGDAGQSIGSVETTLTGNRQAVSLPAAAVMEAFSAPNTSAFLRYQELVNLFEGYDRLFCGHCATSPDPARLTARSFV
jgi:hypothetical protein